MFRSKFFVKDMLTTLRRQTGTTIIELLIASSLLTVVLGSTYFAFGTTSNNFNLTMQNNETFEIARRANNEMTDKIKRAELPLIQASSETISFNLDLYKDASNPGPEMVTFMYQFMVDPETNEESHVILKIVQSSTGTVLANTTVATNVINKLVFNYIDVDGQDIIVPQDSSDPNYRTLIQSIKFVRITSRVEVEEVKGHPRSLNLQSEVNLRHAP